MEQPPILPSTFSHGCNRKFNISWLGKYPWLRYSPKLDAVFCGPCALFVSGSNRKDKGSLVNTPFFNWVKISDVLLKHSKHVYHCESLQQAETLKTSTENSASRINVMMNKALAVTD